jgi:hypothetical protein
MLFKQFECNTGQSEISLLMGWRDYCRAGNLECIDDIATEKSVTTRD